MHIGKWNRFKIPAMVGTGLDEENNSLLLNAQAIVVTFENDWNVGLIIDFGSVI
jgi:hypothetical protein